jgi:hypothetical protein
MRMSGHLSSWLAGGSVSEVRGTRLLARVCELLTLDARRNELDAEELARWLDLDESLRGVLDDPRVAPRVPLGLPARIGRASTGEEAAGWIADLSVGGAFLETRIGGPVGARLVVRVGPGRSGYEWRLPAEVVRVDEQRGGGLGVRWVGAPLVLRHHGGER